MTMSMSLHLDRLHHVLSDRVSSEDHSCFFIRKRDRCSQRLETLTNRPLKNCNVDVGQWKTEGLHVFMPCLNIHFQLYKLLAFVSNGTFILKTSIPFPPAPLCWTKGFQDTALFRDTLWWLLQSAAV